MMYAIITRARWTRTVTNARGKITGVRWEWGIGKGAWKRRLRREFPGIQIRPLYFLVGTRYTLSASGSKTSIDRVWKQL